MAQGKKLCIRDRPDSSVDWGAASKSSAVLIGVQIPTGGMSFSKLPFSPLLSYLGDCEILKTQNPKPAITQCRGEEILRTGGGSPPASQQAELISISCHRGKLRRTKVPLQKQQTNKKQKKARKGTKKYRNTEKLCIQLYFVCVL